MARRSVVVKESEPEVVVPPPLTLLVHQAISVEIRVLNPAVYNPRTITLAKFEALKGSIRRYGFLDPIIVQRSRMAIVGGHQRLKAVKEICVEDSLPYPMIPVIVLDLTDREAKKLNILLNNARGDWDMPLLGELLSEMNREEKITIDELTTLGYEDDQPEKLLRLIGDTSVSLLGGDGSTDEPGGFGKSITLSLEFNDKRLRDAAKKAIKEKAEIVGKKTGDYLADLLGLKVT